MGMPDFTRNIVPSLRSLAFQPLAGEREQSSKRRVDTSFVPMRFDVVILRERGQNKERSAHPHKM